MLGNFNCLEKIAPVCDVGKLNRVSLLGGCRVEGFGVLKLKSSSPAFGI